MTPSFLTLQELLAIGRDKHHLVATGIHHSELHWQPFATLVESIAARLPVASSGAWGVYCEDPALAGAALLALWQKGLTAWLPGNVTPETLHAMENSVVGWISDSELPISNSELPISNSGLPTTTREIISLAADLSNLDAAKSASPKMPTLNSRTDAAADPIALYVFTSGSSGEPKAIPKRMSQLQAEINNLETLWGGLLENSRILASVSHQHVYGLLFRLLWPLCSGRTFVRDTVIYPEQWLAATAQLERVTWVASPALYKRFQTTLPWFDLRNAVVAMFSSGGQLPAENAAFLAEQIRQPVIEVFGSSETGGVAWRCANNTAEHWTPFPGIIPTLSAHGALCIQSPYLPSLEACEMGDSAELQADGTFRLGERLDRIVKIEEKRVSLPQMEHQLNAHPWVKESHVLPLSNDQGRQSLGAVVVMRADVLHQPIAHRKALTDSLRQHLANAYEGVVIPKKWRFVTEIPVNAQGKRTRQAMAALFHTVHAPKTPEVLYLEHNSALEKTVVLMVPAKLAYFEGHFKKAAILPGVVQVQWALQLGETLWPLPDAFSDLEVLKFQRVITPSQRIVLNLRFDPAKQKLYFQYLSTKGNHSSGRIVLKAGTGG